MAQPESPPKPMSSPGRVKHIGPYVLGDSLGQGTFAQVKKATHRKTNEQFAIKIMDKRKILGEGLEPQLKREVSIMLGLNHPNIIKMVEVLQSENNVYIVLELVQGGELYETIKEYRKLDEPTARRYFQQLLCGLNACHQNGICHRDLKPENLLISNDGLLKIADFGLANLQKPNEYLKTVCGTPNYVAPEVLIHKLYDGFKSDLWSCGCVLYVMLSGRLAFSQKTLPELISKIKKGEYVMHPDIPENAADLIRKLLVVDPAQRYTIEEVSKHPWFAQDGWDPRHLQVHRVPSQGPGITDVEDPKGASQGGSLPET